MGGRMLQPDPGIQRHLGAYHTLLRLYPPGFRREYGPAMVQVFADQLHHGGGSARPGRLWFATIRDLLASAPLQRMETIMLRGRFVLGFLVTGALVALVIGGITVDDPGRSLLVAAVILAVQLAILGLAYLYRRVAMRPTESAWQGSLVRHWWAVASLLIAAFYLFAGISQLVDEPRAGHVTALAVSAGFAGLIAAGLVLRARRPGTLGTWLIVVGILPAVGTFWFLPVLITAVLALIGALAEAIGGGSRLPPVRHSV